MRAAINCGQQWDLTRVKRKIDEFQPCAVQARDHRPGRQRRERNLCWTFRSAGHRCFLRRPCLLNQQAHSHDQSNARGNGRRSPSRRQPSGPAQNDRGAILHRFGRCRLEARKRCVGGREVAIACKARGNLRPLIWRQFAIQQGVQPLDIVCPSAIHGVISMALRHRHRSPRAAPRVPAQCGS